MEFEQIGIMTDFDFELASLDPYPAWSLSQLLNRILPKHIEGLPFEKWYDPWTEELTEKGYPNELNGDLELHYNGSNWVVNYDEDGFYGTLPQAENPIEAIVRAIVLLDANGYSFSNRS